MDATFLTLYNDGPLGYSVRWFETVEEAKDYISDQIDNGRGTISDYQLLRVAEELVL